MNRPAGQLPLRAAPPPVARRPPGPRRHPQPAVLAAIAAGGFIGGPARYLLGRAIPAESGAFPWATFAVNVSGSFALALVLVLVLEVWPPTRYVRPFAAVGLLGSYTTFSTWMVEEDRLLAHGHVGTALAYLVASLAAGLVAVALGLTAGRALRDRMVDRRRHADRPAGEG